MTPLPEPLVKQILRLKGTPPEEAADLQRAAPVLSSVPAAFAAVTWDRARKYVIGSRAVELQWESGALSARISTSDAGPLLRIATDEHQYGCVVRADDVADDPVVYTVAPGGAAPLPGGRPLSSFLKLVKTVAKTASPKAQLLEAIRDGDGTLVVSLLASGSVIPKELDKSGLTPLHYAVMARLPDAVDALLAAGADPNAQLREEMKLTKKYLDVGWTGGRPLWTGETPLLAAAWDRPRRRSDDDGADLRIVRALLKAGAVVDGADALHRTPLYVAAGNILRHFDAITAELLAAGANPNVTVDGTPLSLAFTAGTPERVRALLAAGANPNLVMAGVQIRAVKGPTPVHAAAVWGFDDLLTQLLDAGGDPNVQAADGSLPLACAHQRTMPVLVARGARSS